MVGIYDVGIFATPRQNREEPLVELLERFITLTSRGLFRKFLSFRRGDDCLYVRIHPCANQDLKIMWNSDSEFKDAMVYSVPTASVGPGYYAYIIELMYKVGVQMGVHWSAVEKGSSPYWEDVYHKKEDFNNLQTQNIRWLKELFTAVIDRDIRDLLISFPDSFHHIIGPIAIAYSHLGMWTKEWALGLLDSKSGVANQRAKDFFIWWNIEDDAEFYKRTAIGLLNVECSWAQSRNAHDVEIATLISKCLEEARKLDPLIALPELDWSTIIQIINNEPPVVYASRYGFKKLDNKCIGPDGNTP